MYLAACTAGPANVPDTPETPKTIAADAPNSLDTAAVDDPAAADDDDPTPLPTLRIIESAAHPAASRNAPKHQHNMIPFEAAAMSSGADIEQFAEMWRDSVRKGMHDNSGDDDDDDAD